MKIAAISNFNLYSKMDNNSKSDVKFYSNNVQENDKVSFTSKYNFDIYPFNTFEYEAIYGILRGEGKLYAKVNNLNFKKITEQKSLHRGLPNVTDIIYYESKDGGDSSISSLYLPQIIANSHNLNKIICVKPGEANKSFSYRIIYLPVENSETKYTNHLRLANAISETEERIKKLNKNINLTPSELLSRTDLDVNGATAPKSKNIEFFNVGKEFEEKLTMIDRFFGNLSHAYI